MVGDNSSTILVVLSSLTDGLRDRQSSSLLGHCSCYCLGNKQGPALEFTEFALHEFLHSSVEPEMQRIIMGMGFICQA